MPLHRDIFWIGKQWSVTGYGLQAIDPKLKGKFDIEVSRIWDDGLRKALSDKKWFNAGDFDKGLAQARKHYPQPPRKAVRKVRQVSVAPPLPDKSRVGNDKPKAVPKANPNPASANFTMRIIGCRARFLPTLRVRVRWQH